jgi:hypothetical protein
MSGDDVPTHVAPATNYDSDESSSSNSIFNRTTIPIISSSPKVMNNEQLFKSNSQFRLLEEKINNQNATLYHQQFEITNLHKVIQDLYNRLNHSKSVANSVSHSPALLSRPNSAHNYTHNNDIKQRLDLYSSASPTCIQHSYETCTSLPVQTTSFHHTNALTGANEFKYLQETLNQTNAALERLGTEINHLRKENDEHRHFQSFSGINPSNASTRMSSPSAQNSHTSAFIPIVTASKPPLVNPPTNTIFTSSAIMPFTMSLSNTLPSFSGKENEMPSKFITEFEIRASGLFGYNDDYLIRAVQQALSDSALTWFIQAQQEQSITTWAQFKQLFLSRFRTPEKKELLRGRLRTLWQGDNESTVDYFERLKALISEIEPETSIDYIKRKFLQKLRKDIRDKITLGLTSSLSDLVQKAIEIESNIIQQKIDDKLRAAQKEENQNKHKTTIVNNLYNVPKINSSHLSSANIQDSYDNHDHNYNYNKNRNYSVNNSSRTFTNSTRSSPRTTQIQNESSVSRPIFNRNTNVKHRNNNRWCSFCSSSSHNWFHCYSNPNGPNYQPEYYRPVQQYQQQQQLDQQFTSPPDYSQQHADRQHHYQPQNQNVLINQQQQHYEQPPSSSYLTSQRSSVSGNVQGSRY